MARERVTTKLNQGAREKYWPTREAPVTGLAVEEAEEQVLPEVLEAADAAESEPEEEVEIETEPDEGADPITLYLQEIGAFPLLSREGEVELARKKEEDILDIDGLGTKGVQEIKKVLAGMGVMLK